MNEYNELGQKHGLWSEQKNQSPKRKDLFIESFGKYVNGAKEGLWVYFHSLTNQIVKEEEYQNGVLHGLMKRFHKLKVVEFAQFKNGLHHGKYEKLDFNGNLNFKGVYYNNEKLGYWFERHNYEYYDCDIY